MKKLIDPVKAIYEAVKATNPITTKAKPGVDVKTVVKQRQPELFNIFLLERFDWTNDLDGILDYLYGLANNPIQRFPQAKDVIKVIEDNCIITEGKV